MTTDDLEALKRQLRLLLPERILHAAERYGDFAGQVPSETAKEFAAHHAACKSALAHIDLLVKLLRWAADEAGLDEEKEKEKAPGESDFLIRAREALEREETDDDKDDAP
jgi:hypothetical protein